MLREFWGRGLSIKEGIAEDARLVGSASKPLSNEELEKQREKRNRPEGQLDKNGTRLKFGGDLDSDWVVRKDKANYGLSEHRSVEVKNDFVLATTLTAASQHDSNYLSYLTIASCHTDELIKKVYADKGGTLENRTGYSFISMRLKMG